MFVGGSATSGVDYVALGAGHHSRRRRRDDAVRWCRSTMPCSRATRRSPSRCARRTGYIVGSPSIATVTITSDDVAPDLTVSALTVPAKAAPGGTIAVTDTTRNQGTGAGPASQTSFYLSRDVFLDGADSLLGGRPVEALAVGAASTATASVTLPDDLATGTYFLFAKADGPAQRHRGQRNEQPPRLGHLDRARSARDQFHGACRGGGRAAPSPSATRRRTRGPRRRLHRSRRSISRPTWCSMPATSFCGSRGLAALAAGATSTAGTTLTLPATLATGTYYLIAQADGGAAIAELNEMNNGRASAIRIGPDLVVSSFSAPIRAAAGGTIAVTEATANSGSSPARGVDDRLLSLAQPDGGAGRRPSRTGSSRAGPCPWPIQHGDDDPDAAAGGVRRLVRPGQCRRRSSRDRNAGNEQRPFRQCPDRSGSDVRLRHFAERRGRGQHDIGIVYRA